MEEEIFKKLERILRNNKDTFGISKKKEITPETNFEKDLEFDSLDKYELLYLTEGGFKISIPEEKINEFETIKDYMDYIKGYKV